MSLALPFVVSTEPLPISCSTLWGTLFPLSSGSSYAPSWAAVLQEQEQIMGVAGMRLGAASAIPGKANLETQRGKAQVKECVESQAQIWNKR